MRINLRENNDINKKAMKGYKSSSFFLDFLQQPIIEKRKKVILIYLYFGTASRKWKEI